MVAQRSTAQLLRSSAKPVVRNSGRISQRAHDALIAESIGLLCEIEGLHPVDQLGDVIRKSLPGALRLRRALIRAGIALPPALGGEV
ncbi:hypothetical protein FHS31_000809 [Sphingomonas vulcanisoli]|uniref:Uncharacterized protein n=1 Tax=Sphingomonas vulcanisoli TaxID=1658060 RepID=A0ABX0TNV9_9SPHN|nr:hypothetical protein [Sphingomonas vulcanisoli]NIJ07213.1 hypothetical protein [Sphingomonas vulcanisoli]